MTILELSRLKSWSQFFYYQPFVYQAIPGRFTGVDFWLSLFGVPDNTVSDNLNVLEFLVSPAIIYDQAASFEDCIATSESWHWDYATQVLTVHFGQDVSVIHDTLLYGEADGYSDDNVVYIDGIEYLPLIEQTPEIAAQQDIVDYELLASVVGSITLRNQINRQTGQGYLDFLISENVYGNAVNLYTVPDTGGDLTRADMTQRIGAVVDDYDISQRSVTIRFKDKRQSQSQVIPTDIFTIADYPDIDDQTANTVIPLMYGVCREVPATCTNSTTSSGAVAFRAALSLTSIGTVYVQENDVWTVVTPASTSLATGEFTLSEADGRDTSGNVLPCKLVDAEGISVASATDIIVDMNQRYLGLNFNSSHYDTTEWAAEETALSAVGLFIDSETEIPTVIRDLQNGSNVGFRYEIKPDGRRTIRIDDETRTPVLHIPNLAIRNRDEIPVSTDSELLIAELRVKYGKSYESGRFLSIKDTSMGDTVEAAYRQRPYKEIETLLVSESDAEDRVQYMTDRFSTIRGIVDIDVMGSEYQNLRIYDIITAELTPGFVDLDNSTVNGRVYYDVKKIKVLSYSLDLRAKTNRITGVIIGDA